MQKNFFSWIIAHPVVVIILSIIVVMAAALGMSKLRYVGDYGVYFSSENPQLAAFERMEEVYGASDNVAMLIVPEEGSIFTSDLLVAIRDLTNDAWAIPHARRIDSIVNYQHTYAEDDDLIVEDLISNAASFSKQELERIEQLATNEPLLVNKLVAHNGRAAVVNVTIELPGEDILTEEPEVAAAARRLATEFEANNPGAQVHLSGITMLNTAFLEAAVNDNVSLVPLMFLLVAVILWAVFRTLIGTVSILIIVIASIATTMGLAGWAGFYLTGASSSAPIMILTLVIADCVHVLTTMVFNMRDGERKDNALLASLQLNFKPVMLTSVTTAVGFLSMNFSDSPPFQDLGNMVAVGMLLAFAFSIILFPALLTLLPLKIKPQRGDSNQMMQTLANVVIKQRGVLLPVMSLVIIGVSLLTLLNEINNSPKNFLGTSVPFRHATDLMEERMSGMTTIEVSIDSKSEGGINEPAFIEHAHELVTWLRDQEATDHVSSITDTYKRLNKNMHGDEAEWYRLPDNRELAAQYLLLYEMSLPFNLDLSNQISLEQSASRFVATFRNVSSKDLMGLERRIVEWFGVNAPQFDINVSSTMLMFAHLTHRNIAGMLLGTTLALLLISLLMTIALRSFSYGFLSLLPNLAPAAIGFGLWALWSGVVDMGISLVVGMTLGIVVDYSVHFLIKYLRAREDMNSNAEDAVRYAFASVGQALWFTTLVLFVGFMCLAQSDFRINGNMGLLTAVIILVALIVDFLFLPPLLMKLDRWLHPESKYK
ncbi:MAG: MMPL family transporter [Pseudomonadota bacterium]